MLGWIWRNCLKPLVNWAYKMAKPQHCPTAETREIVENMALCGSYTQPEIAAQLKISDETLRKYYREELDKRRIVLARVGKTVVQAALEGNIIAAMFVCKTQLGWRETNRTELTGADGGPIETKKIDTPEFEPLSMEQWQQKLNAHRAQLN
jgi:hypothetical protein